MKSLLNGRSGWAALVPVVGLAAGAAASPVVWQTGAGGNGNSYDVIADNTITWDQARDAAQAAGGQLATIDSAQEQAFVESVMASNNAPTGSYWFGIAETGTEGTYAHVDGTPLGFTNWLTGEPNNANGAENVGAVLWSGAGADATMVARRGKWNDEPMSGYPTNGLPTPGQADVLRGGYLVEVAPEVTGNEGGNGGNGGGSNAVPLPAAVFAFPLGAAFAGLFYRRMRR